MSDPDLAGLRVFSTCPQSRDLDPAQYGRAVSDAARWSEAAGCEGMLVYADNGIVDPWLVAQLIVQATETLCPLVAVQPAYMHPYSAAKMVSSLAYLHGRRLWLNLVAGGFRNDLVALGDQTPHDERYARIVEYGRLIQQLVDGEAPASLDGRYYKVDNLRLTPSVPSELRPGMMISGSSPAGQAAARELGAVPIKYPQPATQEEPQDSGQPVGMRIGVVSRAQAEEAWRVAYERFPEDRSGQIAHRLAMQVSDSQWHRQLGELARAAAADKQAYWLGPFENYQTFCPYLVGDHPQVESDISSYMTIGFSTFVLDIPATEEDLTETAYVLRRAWQASR